MNEPGGVWCWPVQCRPCFPADTKCGECVIFSCGATRDTAAVAAVTPGHARCTAQHCAPRTAVGGCRGGAQHRARGPSRTPLSPHRGAVAHVSRGQGPVRRHVQWGSEWRWQPRVLCPGEAGGGGAGVLLLRCCGAALCSGEVHFWFVRRSPQGHHRHHHRHQPLGGGRAGKLVWRQFATIMAFSFTRFYSWWRRDMRHCGDGEATRDPC